MDAVVLWYIIKKLNYKPLALSGRIRLYLCHMAITLAMGVLKFYINTL